MSSKPATPAHRDNRCPKCGAEQPGPALKCWLCENPLDLTSHLEPSIKRPPAPVERRFSFALSTLMLVMTLASVAMGLLVAVPGLGILACILMVPVFVRTTRVVRHREKAGQAVAPAEKVALFLTSFGVASVLSVVVGVSAFCSFCGVCLVMFGMGARSESGLLTVGVAMCFAAVVGLLAIGAMVRWIRRRYRRDIGQQ